MSARNCYALLVGIDKYQAPVPPLDGCVNDMRAMRDYLVRSMRRSGTPLHMEVLENEEATRLHVVQKFEKHLARATKEDFVFFYFSGHGSQERAHEIFYPIEEDRKNETIVCYDSRSPDGMDLADKELSTLLDVVAQQDPHIVVIMDCCNSGSGTRGTVKTRAVRDLPPRTRSLDSYILPRQTQSRAAFNFDEPSQMIVPNPRHVAMSAAQSFQLAKETTLGGSPRGVFTYSLLEVLNNAVGPMTYEDLMRRVRSLVSERTFEQTPQLYAARNEDSSLIFFDGTTHSDANYYALEFDRDEGWKLDAGSIHGIIGDAFSSAKTTFNVFAEDASESELSDPSMALGRVSVKSVFPAYTLVRAEGGLFLSKDKTYRARLHDMAVPRTKVFVQASGQAERLLLAALTEDNQAGMYLSQVQREEEADYTVIATPQQQYVITRQTDKEDQPLVEQIHGFSQASAETAIDYLVHIAKWDRTLTLQNPGSMLPSEAVKVEFVEANQDQVLTPGSLGVVFRYDHARGSAHYPKFRVRVVNRGQQRFYCGLLYLSSSFEIRPALPQGGVWLEPGQMAWVNGGSPIPGHVSDNWVAIGQRELREVFKVIFSNREFDATLMRQPALNEPKQVPRNLSGQGNTRSLVFGSTAIVDADDWNSNQASVRLVRVN